MSTNVTMVLTQSHWSNFRPSNFTWPALGINHLWEFGFDTWHIVASICTSWIFMVCSIFFVWIIDAKYSSGCNRLIYIFVHVWKFLVFKSSLPEPAMHLMSACCRLLFYFTCTIFSIWKIFIFIISIKELPVPYLNPI